MHLIVSPFILPEENLAFEEYLFKVRKEDYCLIYRNTPSVIVGKHQNVFAEVNLPYCIEHSIPILRRISGGGTVYHDLGNINISLIKSETGENKVNYQPLLDLVIIFLKSKDLDIRQGERNDLYLGEKKITGTACHIFKSRTLHHGTLLFDANMKHLRESTKVTIEVETKSVQSKRSSVINICEMLDRVTAKQLMESLVLFASRQNNWHIKIFDKNIKEELFDIIKERYSNPDWNIDYSPKATIFWPQGKQKLKLHVLKGYIESIEEDGESLDESKMMRAEPKLGMRMFDLIIK